ncbi:MAG: hypothetical protein H7274_16990 [Rhodoferax sp.]|nr:hypothetical protein [Rhodoferax sp.]
MESRLLNALAVIAGRQQDLVAMLEASQQATRLRRALGDRRNEAIGLGSLGAVWLELGDFGQARRDLEEALRLHEALGDRALVPIVMANLSQLALWQSEGADARDKALAALQIAESVQALDLQALALWCLGNAEFAARHFEEASAAFQRAHAITEPIGSALQHDALAGQARVSLVTGNAVYALALIEPLLAHLKGEGSLEGTLGERLIQLTCYQVLMACRDERAIGVLERMHARLEERAATITDPSLRESFLSNVPENREIIKAWLPVQSAATAV